MKNKVIAALLSLLIAFGLWLYVITVEQPGSEKTYHNISVVLQNENILTERGLMITSEIPTVTLTLAGNRSDLNILDENNINLLVNMAGIEAPGTHLLSYTISLPGSIAGNAITTQSADPELITIKVEKRVTKTVDVVVEYIGSVPEGFIADKENAVLDYTSIEVSGPESVVSQITQAKIRVDLTDKSETVVGEFIYDLCDENGEPVDAALVKTNVEAVNLTVKILRVKEITLAVNVVSGGGASEATSSITIDPLTIRVSGSDALLEDLDVLELGTINLGEMLNEETLTFPIVLPEGVTNETGVTEATVDVKFPNLGIRKLSVKNIQAINVPEGMEVDMITKALEVTIRGPVRLVNAVAESDITVSVDFSNTPLGTATMNAIVTVGDEFTGVGAVGSYSVSATLRELTGEEE